MRSNAQGGSREAEIAAPEMRLLRQYISDDDQAAAAVRNMFQAQRAETEKITKRQRWQ